MSIPDPRVTHALIREAEISNFCDRLQTTGLSTFQNQCLNMYLKYDSKFKLNKLIY